MINIGPWWVYDTLIISIILISTINGVFRNIWAILFFAVGEIIIAVICFFVSKVITDSIGNFIVGQLSQNSVFNGLANIIGDLSGQILKMMNLNKNNKEDKGLEPQFSDKGGSDALVAFILSSIINFVCYFILMIILNVILVILYRTIIKNKFDPSGIKLYSRLILGTMFGFITGLVLSYPIYMVASSPFVTNNSIKVQSSSPDSLKSNSFLMTENENENINYQLVKSSEKAFSGYKTKYSAYNNLDLILKDSVEDLLHKFSVGENSFSEYAVSSKIYEIIHLDKSTLARAVSKYIYQPLKMLAEKSKNIKIDDKDLVNSIDNIEDTVLKGYASDNPKDLPISLWINLLPIKSRNIIRMLLDIFLTLPEIVDGNISFSQEGTDDKQSSGYGDAHILDLSMKDYFAKHYFVEKNGKDIDEQLEEFKGFDRNDFINWYKITAETKPDDQDATKYTNQFIVAKNGIINNEKIGDKPKDNSNRYIIKMLDDPKLLWNFLKNLAYINNLYTTPGTLGFLPNIYTSLYLVRGMEVVESGDYFKSVFGYTYQKDSDSNEPAKIDNGILAKYLDFMKDINDGK